MVTCTNLTHGNNSAGVTSVATASITPPALPVFASITSRTASGDPNHATATGNGITWVEVLSVNYDNAGSQKRLTVLRGMGANPSTGTITFDFAGQTQTDIAWVIDYFSFTNLTGTNASGSVMQSASNTDTSGTGTTLTATLNNFTAPTNATYGVCAIGNKTLTFTPGSGFTKIGEDEATLNGIHLATEFKGTNDTTVDFTSSVAGELAVIALEIAASRNLVTIIDTLRPRPFAPGLAR